MKVSEAISQWSEASSVADVKGTFIRNGNWEPISRALRHFKDDTAEVELVADGVLKVTPSASKKVGLGFGTVVKVDDNDSGDKFTTVTEVIKPRPTFYVAVQ